MTQSFPQPPVVCVRGLISTSLHRLTHSHSVSRGGFGAEGKSSLNESGSDSKIPQRTATSDSGTFSETHTLVVEHNTQAASVQQVSAVQQYLHLFFYNFHYSCKSPNTKPRCTRKSKVFLICKTNRIHFAGQRFNFSCLCPVSRVVIWTYECVTVPIQVFDQVNSKPGSNPQLSDRTEAEKLGSSSL